MEGHISLASGMRSWSASGTGVCVGVAVGTGVEVAWLGEDSVGCSVGVAVGGVVDVAPGVAVGATAEGVGICVGVGVIRERLTIRQPRPAMMHTATATAMAPTSKMVCCCRDIG